MIGVHFLYNVSVNQWPFYLVGETQFATEKQLDPSKASLESQNNAELTLSHKMHFNVPVSHTSLHNNQNLKDMSDSLSSIGSKLSFFEENIRKNTDSRSKIFIANVSRKSSKKERSEYRGRSLAHMSSKFCRDDSCRSLVSETDQSLSTACLTQISDDVTMNSSRNRSISSSLVARVTFLDDSINNSETFAQINFNDSTPSWQHGVLPGSTRNEHDFFGNGVGNDASCQSISSLRPDSWCGMTIEANKLNVESSDNDEEFYQSFSSVRPSSWASPV